MRHLASQDDASLLLTLVAHISNSISIPFSVSISIFIASAAAAAFAAASYIFPLITRDTNVTPIRTGGKVTPQLRPESPLTTAARVATATT